MPQPFKQRDTVFLPDLDARFPDHTWVFWASPALAVMSDLLLPFSLEQRRTKGETISLEDEAQAEADYFAAVSECVLETGDSALDLSTPARVRAAFETPDFDLELLGGIITAYAARLLTRRGVLEKKAPAPSTPTAG